MVWQPASKPGDTDPLISDAKRELRKFSYGRAADDGTDIYTDKFSDALVQYKTNVRLLVQRGVRPGPLPDTDSQFDWATKVQMNLIARSTVPGPSPAAGRPLYISVEGHLSDMFVGPAAEVGRVLEAEGLVQWQPTGYNNTAIPFDNESGVRELVRFFNDPRLMPPGRRWAMGQFSQGDIVGSEFMLRHVFPPGGIFHHRLDDWVGTLAYGAPYREKDVIAPWVLDPPRPGTQGISDRRMTGGDHGGKYMYVCRRGDIYTENEDTEAGQKKTAIYKAVQGQFLGQGSVFLELLEIGINPTPQMIAVFQAIVSGVMFVGNMSPHGGYDLGPCFDFMRRQVRSAVPV